MPAARDPRLATPAVALLLTLAAAGCGGKLDAPPVEVAVRDSLVGAGKVLQVTNTSDRELLEVRVDIRAPDGGRRSFTQESVAAYGGFELGWKKLGGWEVPAGSHVTVGARGYLRRYRGSLPAE